MEPVTIATLLTTIGFQYLAQRYCNEESLTLAKCQQEHKKAMMEDRLDHAQYLQTQMNQLQVEMEEKVHQMRIQEIIAASDQALKDVAFLRSIENWPLNVLPFVMNGECLCASMNELQGVISPNCFLTPSNNKSFNLKVLGEIDVYLESMINEFWSARFKHPITYYGGAWKNKGNLGFHQIEEKINQICTRTKSVPTIVISPFFQDNGIDFRIRLWGMGHDNEDPIVFSMDNAPIVSSQNLKFSHFYNKELNFNKSDDASLIGDTITEFAVYLHFLIGFISDQYYRNVYNISPLLPYLIVRKKINIDGMPWLICEAREFYIQMMSDSSRYTPEKNNLDLVKAINILSPNVDIFKNNNKQINSVIMDANTYSSKKDELLSLLNEIIKVRGIQEDEMRDFLNTSRKLQENQYNIVLVGEFQGGKSTTFNALCGGREISPRGAMVKTSAICLTAANLSDDSAEEFALVEWKNQMDLINVFSKYISLISPEELHIELEENDFLYKHIDFSNPTHISAINAAIDRDIEYTSALANKIDAIDISRIAKLILCFINDEKIKDLMSKSRFSVSEIAGLTVFPKNWEKKWLDVESLDSIRDHFTVEEAFFAFVKEIHCYIHSTNLSRLGCSVTDCPGLFASSWDTSIALQAMSNANAIIYLVSGSKQMTQEDEKSIGRILEDKRLASNLFFAINTRTSLEEQETFYDEDLSILKKLGISTPKIYNAHMLLNFLAEFGLSYLDGKLDEYTITRYLNTCKANKVKGESVNDTWCNQIRNQRNVCDLEDLDDTALTKESASIAKHKSGCEAFFEDVENSIVQNKAKSILIDNGAMNIRQCLASIENRLALDEKHALDTVEESEKEWATATDNYTKFKKECTSLIDSSFERVQIREMAENAYNREIANAEFQSKIALDLAIEVPEVINFACRGNAALQAIFQKCSSKDGKGWFAEHSEEAKKKVNSVISPVVHAVIERHLSGAIARWQKQMFDGSSTEYQSQILPTLNILSIEISKKWETYSHDNNYLKSIDCPPIISAEGAINGSNVIDNIDIAGTIGKEALKDIIAEICLYVVANVVGLITTLIVDAIVTGGLGILAWVLLQAGTTLIVWAKGAMGMSKEKVIECRADLSRKQREFYDKTKELISKELSKNSESTIKGLEECPAKLICGCKQYFLNQLGKNEKKLLANIDDCKKKKQSSVEEQQKVANLAKNIRENDIIPLIQRTDIFIQDCLRNK